jgi:CheY-like chemotaxis protein
VKRTVLVIDDDKMILDMIQGILEDKFEVSAVNDGQKAFRVLERIHPDVILLDLKMPKVSSGLPSKQIQDTVQ